MADIFQGNALPSTTSTTQTQQTAPDYYNNYLQNISDLGQQAVQGAGVAGFSPLQQQALQMAPQTAFAGSSTLGQASGALNNAANTTSPDVVNNYLNPYTSNVVDEMGRLTQRNIQENIMPELNASAVASGNFGSQRQGNIAGQTLRDIQADLIGRQYGALNTGYNTATTAAQNDLNRQLQSGQAMTQLGGEQNAIGTGGLNTMFNLGAKEQQLGQSMLDKPMSVATDYSKLMNMNNIPTGDTRQTTAPGQAGNFGLSPVNQISSLAALLKAYQSGQAPNVNANGTVSAGNATVAGSGGAAPMRRGGPVRMKKGGIPPHAAYHDGKGNLYDKDGYLVG
jgi:hypothetical protein